MTLDPWRRGEDLQKERIVGKPVFRKEGVAKVCGAPRYIDDFSLPGMIFGATVRSAIPRGRVLSIEFGPGIPWDEFTIVTARDIPGKNYIALINQDWPCLADGFVNHPQEAILLLAILTGICCRWRWLPSGSSTKNCRRCTRSKRASCSGRSCGARTTFSSRT